MKRSRWVVDIAAVVGLTLPCLAVAGEPSLRRGGPQVAPLTIVDGTPRPLLHDATVTPPVRSTRGRSVPLGIAPSERNPASLLTITDEAGMASPLGGDDVAIAQSFSFNALRLQIAADGTAYVGAQALSNQFDVYRSTDGGDTWPLWSSFSLPGAFEVKDFLIAEGGVDRAMVAYRTGLEVRIAYADLNLAVPSWSVVIALSNVSVTHGIVADFETDSVDFPSYFVYLVARSSDGNGDDVWFARSINQGASFEAGYRLASKSAGTSEWFGYPLVGYGDNNYIHVSYTDGSLSTDEGLLQRRIPSWAGGGLPAWEAPVTIDARGNGVQVDNYAMEPSTTGGNVTLLVSVDFIGIDVRYSTDWGATWPSGNAAEVFAEDISDVDLLNLPSGDLVATRAPVFVSGQPFTVSIRRSTTTDPETWSPAEWFSSFAWGGGNGMARLAVDPTRGNRIAVVSVQNSGALRPLRFDAEWRRDPGYPNTDVGFPMAITGGGQTPPAVAEVDGVDAEKEIVFGTRDGNVWVVEHDGSAAPGWPVDIGLLPFDAPVAIGDLVGNGDFTVVSGNTTGQVYALDANGDVLPGWPYDMGTGTNVYVSIGALGPPHLHYVVAASGNRMVALNYLGENVAPDWSDAVIPYARPAAIGDVEGNGSPAEIVSLRGQYLEIRRLTSPGTVLLLNVVGQTFADAATLADVNGDGDLEIAAPTMSGRMYLFHHNGTDYSGAWPITVSPGIALTSAAFGQILGTSEPELVFANSDGMVHVRYTTGLEQTGYPLATGASIMFMPPMLSPVNIANSNVNIGTTIGGGLPGTAYSWRNIPSAGVPGWPRNLPGEVEETFASGDIDNDGRNELVVLGVDFLTVYDVGTPPQTTARNHWPMYGYDAQRTGCLACFETVSDVGDAPAASARATLDIYPNPFNPATTISFELAETGPVTLRVYDVHGRLVDTLLEAEHREAGRHAIAYRANVASGVYFVRLAAAGEVIARKIVLLK